MAVTLSGNDVWTVTVSNDAAAFGQPAISPICQSDHRFNWNRRTKLVDLYNDGYTQLAALFLMFGANNINISQSTLSSPGTSQLLQPTAEGTDTQTTNCN